MFSNGTEYQNFKEVFCERCQKCRLDKHGMPLQTNCKIENRIMACACFGYEFPTDKLVKSKTYLYICPRFVGRDKKVDMQYEKMLEREGIQRKGKRIEHKSYIKKIKGQISIEV